MNTQLFSYIWIEKFLDSWSSLAIGHKLWGDNMSLIDANRQVMEIIGDKWINQSFSVSAFRSSTMKFNTTSKLIEAWESQDSEKVLSILSEVQDFHTQLLEDILSFCDQSTRQDVIEYARYLFDEYMLEVKNSELKSCERISDYTLWIWNKTYSLLSVWEVVAAKVFVKYLKNHGIPAVYVDTPGLKDIPRKDLPERLKDFLKWEFEKINASNSQAIPIIPWYIWGIDGGILNSLGRWYTDYTGERATVSMYDSERYDNVLFYIQKMYGFKSTDPRWLDSSQQAKSVQHLSYDLVSRAISHRWAWAGLINPYALSLDITSRKIEMLVWNPTDSSDIAYIGNTWWHNSDWIELVLWREYNSWYDNVVYGKRLNETHWNNIIYLMGDNIQNTWEIFEVVSKKLQEQGIFYLAGEVRMFPKAELSFVFKDSEDSEKARNILHQEFIKNPQQQVAEVA